jgi:hypothetical protein
LQATATAENAMASKRAKIIEEDRGMGDSMELGAGRFGFYSIAR